MSDDVASQLKERIKDFTSFSLALDESTDAKDTAQLAIYIRGVTNDLAVHEEFVELSPLSGTTTGKDVSQAVIACMDRYGLDFSRLVSVTTNGAPAMVGDKKGAATLIAQHAKNLGHTQTIHRMHCIIHQEALCAKSASLVEVMCVTVKVVNSILACSLQHRQFQALLDEVSAQYGDLVYFTEVRWLSRGAMLSRVWDLRKEIATFIADKKLPYSETFEDPVWLSKLAMLTDVSQHLNELNLRLQGKDLLITEMASNIAAFEVKLRLWEAHLKKKNACHFIRLKECAANNVNWKMCASVITTLREEFAERFTTSRALSPQFLLFTSPFTVAVDDAPDQSQMEIIELQCDAALKERFNTTSSLHQTSFELSGPSTTSHFHVWKHVLLRAAFLKNETDQIEHSDSADGSSSERCSPPVIVQNGAYDLQHHIK